jgi:hypothetical protein
MDRRQKSGKPVKTLGIIFVSVTMICMWTRVAYRALKSLNITRLDIAEINILKEN